MHKPKLNDPLLTARAGAPSRPHYALGMALHEDDFLAEQTYHRGQLARALAAIHGSGTVAGLRVGYTARQPESRPGAGDSQPAELRVEAGLAIDPFGRLIELSRPVCIDLDRWFGPAALPADADAATLTRTASLRDAFDPQGRLTADVFIRFVPCGGGLTPAFARGAADALDAVVAERVLDCAEVRLAPRRPDRLPRPQDPWAGVTGSTFAERLEDLRNDVLDPGHWQRIVDPPVPDEVPEELRQVPTPGLPASVESGAQWVMLARVTFAAAGPVGSGGPRPGAAAPEIDNLIRRFVLTPGAIARLGRGRVR